MGSLLDNSHKVVHGFGQRIEQFHQYAPSSMKLYVGDLMKASATRKDEAALHGLGTVFAKGTDSMPNLIIANLEESLDMLDFRLFLRTLYRSGSMAKADLVLLFPGSSFPPEVARILKEEDASFKKLLKFSTPPSNASDMSTLHANALEGFFRDARSFAEKKRSIMWGDSKTISNNDESQHDYGSVVGFYMSDLDPSDGFSEFLVSPPSQLRRWICYQMLLGLLRFKFTQVMLVDLGGVVILDDVFSCVRKRDFLYLSLEDSSWADTVTVDSAHSESTAEEGQGPWGKSIEDDDEVVALNRQDNSIPSIRSPNGHGQVATIESPDVIDHVIHEPMLKKKGIVGDRIKKARKMSTDSRGLVVRRKKQAMVDKSILLRGSRDSKVKKATEEKRRTLQKNGQDSTGNAMSNDLAKPGAGDLRQERIPVTKRIMMKMVYGQEVWENLEQAEKERKVVSSRVIWGSMRSAKRLANSMAVEIVRVAMQRNSRGAFPDHALLSYLVQKSSHLLGKRVTDSLQVVGNGESMVHSLDNSKQGDAFVRSHDGQRYAILQGRSLNFKPIKSMQTLSKDQSLMNNSTLSDLIRANICTSRTDLAVLYDDCASAFVQ